MQLQDRTALITGGGKGIGAAIARHFAAAGADVAISARTEGDLRRTEMQETMLLRSRIIKSMRDYFEEHDFIDVETPVLGRSTPEGARD